MSRMGYVCIDGRNYFSPCDDCKQKLCFSCLLRKYQADLNEEREKRSSAEYRITHELEPRLQTERTSYDMWLSQVVEDEALKKQETSEWIPIMENDEGEFCNLPDEGEYVLVSDGNHVYIDKLWWWDIFEDSSEGRSWEDNPIEVGQAWMPLPKPYKEVE